MAARPVQVGGEGFLQQRLGKRGDGRHGVHDFVGQHADEFVPRFHLVVVQFLVDVAEGDNAHFLILQIGG